MHYGWIRFSVRPFFCVGCMAQLEGFAYETIPNKSIVAGDQGDSDEAAVQPASLGALALGAPGLAVWRKDQN